MKEEKQKCIASERKESSKRIVSVAWILLFIGYLVGLAYLMLNPPEVVSTAAISSERVSFEVIDEQKAAFYVSGMKAFALGSGQRGPCMTGLFTPARHATVTYGRRGEDAVEITISPAPGTRTPEAAQVGTFESADGGGAASIKGAQYLAVDKDCPQRSSFEFPIWGRVTIGQEFRPAAGTDPPEPSLLIDGSLKVAAHATLSNALYDVTTVTIPVGARVETYDPRDRQAPASGGAIWWGTAYVDPGRPALALALATEAPNIAIYRPNQTTADVIEVSTLARLTEDPDIVRFHIVILVLFAWVWMLDEFNKLRLFFSSRW